MKITYLKGVRVQRPGLVDAEIRAQGFKVLDNGALQIDCPSKRTFAAGMWQSVELVFSDSEPL